MKGAGWLAMSRRHWTARRWRERSRRRQKAAAQSTEGKSLSVALITGGGTGIGRAVALRLAAGGWQREAGAQVAIVLTGRRAEVLEETAQEIRKAHGEGVHVLVHAAYLTLAADVKGLFNAVASNFGRLDLLFNNLGANVPPSTFDKMDFVLSTMPLSPVELRIVKERLDPQPHKVRSCQITMTSWMRVCYM